MDEGAIGRSFQNMCSEIEGAQIGYQRDEAHVVGTVDLGYRVMGEFSHNSEPGVEVQRMDCRGSLEGVAMEGIELNLKEEVICIEHDVRPNAEKVENIVDPREKRVRKWKRALGPKARFWEKLRAQFRK
ncbi:hypothetical protein ACOSQ3_018594 [Xanthoceras sorbifolium]